MAEIILLALLFLICVFVFGFGKSKIKQEDIEAIELKDLSAIWLARNNKNFEDTNENEKLEMQVETDKDAPKEDTFQNSNEETGNQSEFHQLLSIMAENINKTNEKGVHEIFLFQALRLHFCFLVYLVSGRWR